MPLPLEDFAAPLAAPADPPPPRSYEEGLAEGRAQAEAEAASREAAALEQAAEALSDLMIGYGEARQAVLEALGPLFAAITGQLLPDLAPDALEAHLRRYLSEAAAADTARVTLHLAPDMRAAIGARLEAAAPGLDLRADPTLSAGQAVLHARDEESFFDLDQARAEIGAALSALTTTRTSQNG